MLIMPKPAFASSTATVVLPVPGVPVNDSQKVFSMSLGRVEEAMNIKHDFENLPIHLP